MSLPLNISRTCFFEFVFKYKEYTRHFEFFLLNNSVVASTSYIYIKYSYIKYYNYSFFFRHFKNNNSAE